VSINRTVQEGPISNATAAKAFNAKPFQSRYKNEKIMNERQPEPEAWVSRALW